MFGESEFFNCARPLFALVFALAPVTGSLVITKTGRIMIFHSIGVILLLLPSGVGVCRLPKRLVSWRGKSIMA